MRTSKNILTEKEKELVSLLMQDCQSTGDIQTKDNWRKLFREHNAINCSLKMVYRITYQLCDLSYSNFGTMDQLSEN